MLKIHILDLSVMEGNDYSPSFMKNNYYVWDKIILNYSLNFQILSLHLFKIIFRF